MEVLEVEWLGLRGYRDVHSYQQRCVEERLAGRIADRLLLVEHPPVFTLGRRRGAMDNVLTPGEAEVIQVERGGDVTWHGPGQLVGYPIISLREHEGERDLHQVLRRLESAMIEVLSLCGLEGGRRPKYTGVWVNDRKLVSLGIAVKQWTTYHGFALNVECDLSWFGRINPCGLESDVMGSIKSLGGDVPPPEQLRAAVVDAVGHALGRQPRWTATD